MKKRILITGASGMLGATLAKSFTNDFNLFATGNSDFENSPKNYKKFDLSKDSFDELIYWAKPDVIIHSGAITNGNYCNLNPLEAFAVNGVSVRKFLEATNNNVKIIYISTDAVFPSSLHLANEKDCTYPENVYGKSKELGEFFLLNSDRDYAIVRTTIVGLNENKNKTGFVEWIINSSRNNEYISLFDDVVFNPISIWDLASEIKYLISNDKILSEILHIAGNDFCTKYEFGKQLLEELKLPTKKVFKGSIKAFKDRVKRCSDQSMNCEYYQDTYKRRLPSLLKTIESIKKQYNEQY